MNIVCYLKLGSFATRSGAIGTQVTYYIHIISGLCPKKTNNFLKWTLLYKQQKQLEQDAQL